MLSPVSPRWEFAEVCDSCRGIKTELLCSKALTLHMRKTAEEVFKALQNAGISKSAQPGRR